MIFFTWKLGTKNQAIVLKDFKILNKNSGIIVNWQLLIFNGLQKNIYGNIEGYLSLYYWNPYYTIWIWNDDFLPTIGWHV